MAHVAFSDVDPSTLLTPSTDRAPSVLWSDCGAPLLARFRGDDKKTQRRLLMPREAKLFDSAKGSPARALFRLQGNIPPNWIARAKGSRKSLEPDLVTAMRKVRRLRKSRPKAYAT